MTQQESAKRIGRRGMLTGLGAAAVGASVLAAGPAGAAPGDPVVQGADNDAGAAGTILRSTAAGATFEVRNAVGVGGAVGVKASADVGVDASGFDAGVVGFSSNGNGLVGRSDLGYGVVGAASDLGGIGVVASAPDEFSKTALDVRGQVRFARSGVVTVPAGATSATVTGLQVYASTHALAVAQRSTAVWVKAAVPVQASGQLRVYLNAAAPAGGVPVAWWLLEV
ncbi:hypothetical protein ACFFX1_19645 [Dactylosporangium sucinum]|nr:hypothetical protein [Dactylosporangium sucinum]